MKSFDDIWHEKTRYLQYDILAAQKQILETRRELIEFGEKEMRSCKFASGIRKADYDGDVRTKTPIFEARCTLLAGKAVERVEEELTTNSYHCAVCRSI